MKYFISSIFAIVSFILMQCAPRIAADTVLTNGNIITVARKGDRVQALAIKDGKIISAGTQNSVQKNITKETILIDLQGKTVVPGFNDAHLHPSPIYPFESPHATLDVGPSQVNSMDELVAVLKKKADVTPEGLPVKGFGYQDTKLGGHPSREVLDKVSVNHPVIIRHSSGHITAVNSFVLKLAGITKETTDPPGGSFDRFADGEPNGVCRESALRDFFRLDKLKKPAPLKEEEELEGYLKCFRNYMACGITSITEAGSSFYKMEVYKKLQESGLPLRINLLMSEAHVDEVISKGIKQGYGNENLKISGIKTFHGNSLSGRTCWLNEPYDLINPETGKKDYYGIPPHRNQQQLDSLFTKIHTHGLQIACHSNGDREIDMVVNSFQKLQQVQARADHRHRIEHCSVTNDELLKRIKKNNVVIVLHSYIYEHGDKMIAYGPSRWNSMHPNRTAVEMGIAVAQHSDSPVSPAIPLLRIQSLATRTSAEGIVIGENQRITAEDAIRLWTYGGAYASFEEKNKGTLEVGKYADLVVLSEDPTIVSPEKLMDIKIIQTMINGKIVFNSKTVLVKN